MPSWPSQRWKTAQISSDPDPTLHLQLQQGPACLTTLILRKQIRDNKSLRCDQTPLWLFYCCRHAILEHERNSSLIKVIIYLKSNLAPCQRGCFGNSSACIKHQTQIWLQRGSSFMLCFYSDTLLNVCSMLGRGKKPLSWPRSPLILYSHISQSFIPGFSPYRYIFLFCTACHFIY